MLSLPSMRMQTHSFIGSSTMCAPTVNIVWRGTVHMLRCCARERNGMPYQKLGSRRTSKCLCHKSPKTTAHTQPHISLQGPAPNSATTATASPAQLSPAQPNPAQHTSAQPSPAQPCPGLPRPAQPSRATPNPAQPNPALPNPAQHNIAQIHSSQPSSTQLKPAQPSPTMTLHTISASSTRALQHPSRNN